MCVPVSSPDNSGDLDDDHLGRIWPRLGLAAEGYCQLYIHMLALDGCFTS